ncbi:hypothetical protein BPAE_0392g00020 [Botrytis paeoniae]|uniref:Uncharacterized protein n=1 Tax=Botrytis paeoniae TaxID=278948 RepID=A0A4Z1F1C9_9HELO|nr:hypothetical protein BPAE_0392g00020 [Botrytis paeoniae]
MDVEVEPEVWRMTNGSYLASSKVLVYGYNGTKSSKTKSWRFCIFNVRIYLFERRLWAIAGDVSGAKKILQSKDSSSEIRPPRLFREVRSD